MAWITMKEMRRFRKFDHIEAWYSMGCISDHNETAIPRASGKLDIIDQMVRVVEPGVNLPISLRTPIPKAL
jgi:hypothetical protein